MPAIEIEIKNLSQIRAAFNSSPRLMTKNLSKAIFRSTTLIHREEQLNVGGSRGINVVTTGLKSAVTRGISFPTPLKGVLEPIIDYAKFVHDGTRFMKARPFLQDAVTSQQSAVDREFKNAVQDTMNEIGNSV